MPSEYEQFIEEHKVDKKPIPTYEDFISEHKIESKSEKEYKTFIKTHATAPKMQELTFGEKHPNLYGLQGAIIGLAEALGKVGHFKYGDWEEAKKLWKMPPKQMKRQLMMDTAETLGMFLFYRPGVKPLKPRTSEEIAKIPKVAKPTEEFVFHGSPTKSLKELKEGTYFANTPEQAKAWIADVPTARDKGSVYAIKKSTVKDVPATEPFGEAFIEKGLARKSGIKHKEIYEIPAEDVGLKTFDINKYLPKGVKPINVVERVHTALKKAKPIRKQQELIYTKERGVRFAKGQEAAEKAGGGQKGFQARLREFKGEFEKVEFESIQKDISQNDIDSLFDMVENAVPGWDVVSAQRGLGKLFGEFGGKVPTEGELKLLRQVFPKDFIKTLIQKQGVWTRMSKAGYETINVPRSIMSSFDLSAPFRQGIFLAPSHPIRFTQSFLKMFKQFGSEKAHRAVMESIKKKVSYEYMDDLALTEVGAGLAKREEAFMSNLAERIPVIGRGIKASTRAHMGFLNKLRADVFDDLFIKAQKAGLRPEKDPNLTKAISRFVNAASGRGNLGALENSAVALNSVLFSPRLMSSRLTLLNPVYYIRQPAFVRKEALKSLFAFAGMISTVLGLAKVGGLDVGIDPRSANFAKIKIGDTRIDIMGGFQQYLRIAGQFMSGKYISSTTGKEYTLGEGYRGMNRWEIITRALESKMAPVASFAVDWMKQKDITGKPFSVPKSVAKRFVPMVMQDIYDLAGDEPELLPLGALGVFGVGLQTYGPRPRKTKGITAIKGIGR